MVRRSTLRSAGVAGACWLLASCGLDNRRVAVTEAEERLSPGAGAGGGTAGPAAPGAMSPAPGAETEQVAGGGAAPEPTESASGAESVDAPADVCGDGQRGPTEACDDGNQVSGDGCPADCVQVERGFSCSRPNLPCMPFARCGDGIVALTEQCDDGARLPGDGCSELCQLEQGWGCQGEPSVCRRSTCGDGLKEGAESCDDGNALSFDGCSATCQREAECYGTCQRSCGDGFVTGEQCDDGNTLDGDGCSADCRIEPGSVCRTETPCDAINDLCTQRLAIVHRDFPLTQPDFSDNPCNARVTGILSPFLDATGKPSLAAGAPLAEACLSAPASFAAWFTDPAGPPSITSQLVMFDDGGGGYSNRFDATGRLFQVPGTVPVFEGTPLFFPVDLLSGPAAQATPASIPVQYGVQQETAESTLFPGAPGHNFAFTSEVVIPFVYDGSFALTIQADDDVWVFLNGQLALDLGGVHEPITGSVTLNDSLRTVTLSVLDGATVPLARPSSDFGLSLGGLNELRVFHAERQPPISSLMLRSSGLTRARSSCSSLCGDGVLGGLEDCDDGLNNGGYGECDVGCTMGAYCGDGITQAELGETCDSGSNRIAGCRGCRVMIVQ